MNDREKRTVSKMIEIYCRSTHKQQNTLCLDCRMLENYAHERFSNG